MNIDEKKHRYSRELVMRSDSLGNSPWLGQARTWGEYMAMQFPAWVDPFPKKPDDHVLVDGINGCTGLPTTYRIGLELWLNDYGFLYREALSCADTKINARMRAAIHYLIQEI